MNFIFDFDGTLADTSELIVATMQKSIKEMGLPFKNEGEIKATIGVRLEEIPSILWPEHEKIGDTFATLYRKHFEMTKKEITVKLYPGVKETLKALKEKGHNLAIATSRSRRSVEELALQLSILDEFDYMLGGDEVSEGKPHAESIYKILQTSGWKKEDTVMVGDMAVDIQMGKAADVRTCGVSYGNGNTTDLKDAGSQEIISHFGELINLYDR